MQTKDGITAPGGSLQITGGKFGRRAGEGELGGVLPNGFNYYVAGNLYREDGWRQFSPSEVRQAFAKIGWTDAKTSVFLSGAYADNWMTGNGTSDFRFLKRQLDRRKYDSRHHVGPFALVDVKCHPRSDGQSDAFRQMHTIAMCAPTARMAT